jgi:mRNA interferase MazF
VKRGEVWTAAGGPDYAGKPRPVVIIQDDRFDGTQSITVCGLTTARVRARVERIPIEPSAGNGLRIPCDVMIDKIVTIPRSKLARRIGMLASGDMAKVGSSMAVFLGLAG